MLVSLVVKYILAKELFTLASSLCYSPLYYTHDFNASMHMSHRIVRHYMLIKQHCFCLIEIYCIYIYSGIGHFQSIKPDVLLKFLKTTNCISFR